MTPGDRRRAMLVVALFQGAALYALHLALDEKVWPATLKLGSHWMTSFGVTSPVSSAARAVTGLNVDPGG